MIMQNRVLHKDDFKIYLYFIFTYILS